MTKRSADEISTEDLLSLYEPSLILPELKAKMNELVDVLLLPQYLVASHKQVNLRQLWGTDTYTDDSDLVAVLVHTGHVKLKATAPKMPLLVSLRACPAASSYPGSSRNGITSREWPASAAPHAGVSYKVERCLQHTISELPKPEVSGLRPNPITRQIPGSLVEVPPGPGDTFSVPHGACIVVFSLSSEPWFKYSLTMMADQGTKKERWTSTRLRRECLYLEGPSKRYELAVAPTAPGQEYDMYTLSEVALPHTIDAKALEAAGVPLPKSKTTLLEAKLDWEELVWGPDYVRCRGNEYRLLRLLYVPYSKKAA